MVENHHMLDDPGADLDGHFLSGHGAVSAQGDQDFDLRIVHACVNQLLDNHGQQQRAGGGAGNVVDDDAGAFLVGRQCFQSSASDGVVKLVENLFLRQGFQMLHGAVAYIPVIRERQGSCGLLVPLSPRYLILLHDGCLL